MAILISGAHGRGSTMMNLYRACQDHRIPGGEIVGVIGSVPSSPAVERAREHRLPLSFVAPKADTYGQCLAQEIDTLAPDIVCLAGYMRRIPGEVLAKHHHRVVNIHPALLPAFGGQGMYGSHVHQAVYESGVKLTGCTVHFVDADYDTGPIILQRVVPVNFDDTADSIAARVLVAEHDAYPEALRLIAEGRVSIQGRRVRIAEPAGEGI